MSRVALISDIHGNAVALDAVLAELATAAVDEIVCLGDVAAGGPRPREVVGGAPAARGPAGGNTHLQLLRPYRQGLLVNPGSVGLPLGSLRSSAGAPDLPARAEYALVDFGRDDLEVAFRRVPIDVGQLAVETAAMPHATWAADLERRIGRRNARAAA